MFKVYNDIPLLFLMTALAEQIGCCKI